MFSVFKSYLTQKSFLPAPADCQHETKISFPLKMFHIWITILPELNDSAYFWNRFVFSYQEARSSHNCQLNKISNYFLVLICILYIHACQYSVQAKQQNKIDIMVLPAYWLEEFKVSFVYHWKTAHGNKERFNTGPLNLEKCYWVMNLIL